MTCLSLDVECDDSHCADLQTAVDLSPIAKPSETVLNEEKSKEKKVNSGIRLQPGDKAKPSTGTTKRLSALWESKVAAHQSADKNDGCTKEEEGKVSRHNLLNFVEEIDCAIVHIHTQHVDKHQDKRLTGS
jgi:hypothetical protein